MATTSPPPAKSDARRKREQNQLIVLIFGAIVAVAGGIWFLSVVMSGEDRNTALRVMPVEEPEPPPRRKLGEVALSPRPFRLYHEFIAAIQKLDRKEIQRLSQLDESMVDLLLDKDRCELLKVSYPMKRFKMEEEKIEGTKARFTAVYQNAKGFDVEAISFDMEQIGSGPEDWKVVQVHNRYYGASGKTPESGLIVLGSDRTKVAAPFTHATTFVAPEAEPKELPWLAGTTPEQIQKISSLVKDLLDETGTSKMNDASKELVEIGKPAIPALLNAFIGIDVRKDEGNRRANAIDRTLMFVTGLEMGYVAVGLDNAAVPPAMARHRAVRRWFGWWIELGQHKPLKKRVVAEESDH